MVFFEGPYGKNINLTNEDFKKSYKGLVMKGDPQDLKASAKKVNEIYRQQKQDIQNTDYTVSYAEDNLLNDIKEQSKILKQYLEALKIDLSELALKNVELLEI